MKSTTLIAFAFLLLLCVGSQADPVIDPIPAQSVPCGKTLVIPVRVSGTGPMTFTVKSNNSSIIPLIKTGNPYLKISGTYAGDGGSTPAFSGDLIFQLFRDLAPKTVGFISGFAQAGYYNNVQKPHTLTTGTYNSSTFHRIVQLDLTKPNSFIAQGGDPDANDLDSSSDGYSSLPHGPGFSFDNEFSSPLIFTGSAQIAMANSNGTSGYQGTNGSQFFITSGPLRFLDFNHTIFGQLVRDDSNILQKIMAVPVPTVTVIISGSTITSGTVSTTIKTTTSLTGITSGTSTLVSGTTVTTGTSVSFSSTIVTGTTVTPLTTSTNVTASKPLVDVVISSVSVVNDATDAVLFLSAAGMTSNANITITARDSLGASSSQVFTVSTFADKVNDPPILIPTPDVVAPFGRPAHIPFTAEDLESDYVSPGAGFNSSTTAGGSLNGNVITITPDPSNPVGLVLLGLRATQIGSVLRNDPSDRRQVNVGLGVRTLSPLYSPLITCTLSSTNQVIASFRAAQISGTAGNFTGTINWGDGTAISSGSDVVITRIPSPANAFAVSGTHMYAQTGQYPLIVKVSDSLGATVTINNTAFVSNGPLILLGRELALSGGAIASREIASFTDTDIPGALSDYTATIDWGDGTIGAGTIRMTPRGYSVFGSHKYFTNTSYSITVTVTKASGETATAWSSVRVKGVIPAHLPPFPLTHLVAQFGSVTKVSDTVLNANSIIVYNSGGKTSGAVTIRFHLSDDLTTTLPINSFHFPLVSIPPNTGTSFSITNITLPQNTTTTGKRLVLELVYSDPIGDFMNFTHNFSSDPLP